jgi:hypothetical protein
VRKRRLDLAQTCAALEFIAVPPELSPGMAPR